MNCGAGRALLDLDGGRRRFGDFSLAIGSVSLARPANPVHRHAVRSIATTRTTGLSDIATGC